MGFYKECCFSLKLDQVKRCFQQREEAQVRENQFFVQRTESHGLDLDSELLAYSCTVTLKVNIDHSALRWVRLI